MELIKEERKVNARAKFNRGYIADDTAAEGFYTLFISAAPEDYDFSNWTEHDLQDLAKAINAFLKEMRKKEKKKS